ncbi:uncharacterized protein TNCV_748041 [Trichonephila clavipes]|nr:uncharacterized protein TNCV_748041 [Trichonephila clavipes]
MEEQMKALLEGINALKSGQEETKERMENMQRSQEETRKGQQEMQKGLKDMQKSQEETKNELKDRMKKGQEETKQERQKGLENVQKYQEELKDTLEKKIDNVEEKINSVEEKIALKVEEKLAVVEEKIEKEVEQLEERIEGVVEKFSLLSQRMEDLEKKLLAVGNENKSKTNGWNEGVRACQLVASLRGEAAEVLQSLPDIERLNLNSLYSALDLWFNQKYSKEYARLQMKTRLQKTGESLQEYASEVKRLANLAFSDHPATVRETISLQYFVDGLKEGEFRRL